jgi:orotidine-5'-phosphate decarboxylase
LPVRDELVRLESRIPVADERLIVALDDSELVSALELVAQLGALVDFYKVGLTLYTAAGPSAVQALKERGKRVFLDLKLHDIPAQVGGAAEVAASLEVDLLTVHTAGGPAMLRAAATAVAGSRTRLLGVTVLTSLALPGGSNEPVMTAARAAMAAGLDGVVAAAAEAQALRSALGSAALIVTPGIRPAGSDPGDQARVADPETALRQGASHLVVGRPITAAAQPRAAAAGILKAMESVRPLTSGRVP